MEEVEYCGKEKERFTVGGCDFEAPSLNLGDMFCVTAEDKVSIEEMKEKQTHPALRHLWRTLDPLLTNQGETVVGALKRKETEAKREEVAKQALKQLRKKLRTKVKGLSRMEVVQSLVPYAKDSEKAKNIEGGKT